MAQKNVKTKTIKNDTDIEEIEIKEPKANNFFDSIPTDDYIILVYKKDENSRKNEFVDTLYDKKDIEDFSILRKNYGHGTFTLYLKEVDPETGQGDLINTCTIHVAKIKNEQENRQVNNDDNIEEKFINKLASYKQILGGGNSGNSENITAIVNLIQSQSQLQMQALQEMQKQNFEQNQKLLEMQRESELRFQKMLEKTEKKEKDPIEQINSVMSLMDNLRGSVEPDDGNMLTKMLPDLIGALQNNQQSQQVQHIQKKPARKRISDQFSKEFVANVNRENKDNLIKELHEKNKENISLEKASFIINKILDEKGI